MMALLLPVHPAGDGHDKEVEGFPGHGGEGIDGAVARQGADGNLNAYGIKGRGKRPVLIQRSAHAES
jgi:hypothetical protein